MAINLDERYPGRANGKTLSYPQGSFKNRTSPTSKDGTYLEADWANDQLAFFQSLLKVAGMAANGTVDTVEASQYFDALQAMGLRAATEDLAGVMEIATTAEAQGLADDTRALTPKKLGDVTATEARRGIVELATTLEAQGFLDDSRAITAKKLAEAFGVRVGHTFLTNDWAPLPGGLILQWGSVLSSAIGFATCMYPIAFPNEVLQVVATPHIGAGNNNFTITQSGANTKLRALYACYVNGVLSSTAGQVGVTYFALGR